MQRLLWLTACALLLAVLCKHVVPTEESSEESSEESTEEDKQQQHKHLENLWDQVSARYPKYEDTTNILIGLKKAYPNLVKYYSVGKSVEGREMWVINLRENIKQPRALLQPSMKIVANIHGDETVGRALVLMLAVDLVKKYIENNTRVVQLLNKTDIHLMPSINPDGFELATEDFCFPPLSNPGRNNAHGVDLSKNFPDPFLVAANDSAALWKNREPETTNMMIFIFTGNFVLSANFRTGSLLTVYPFNSVPVSVEERPDYTNVQKGVPNPTPDNKVFLYLAKLYAENHKTMTKRKFQCLHSNFTGGIINGALWFNVRGCMPDFNYVQSNTFEITVELSCCKYPPASALVDEWSNNEVSLYKFIEATHMGIRGLVKNVQGNPVEGAEILVEGVNHTVRTTKQGEFWRLLLPGKYKVGVSAVGYKPVEMSEVEVKSTLDLKHPNTVNFTLTK